MEAQVDIHVAISFLVSEATRESCVYLFHRVPSKNEPSKSEHGPTLRPAHKHQDDCGHGLEYTLGCCVINNFIVKPLVWLHSDPAQLEQDIT